MKRANGVHEDEMLVDSSDYEENTPQDDEDDEMEEDDEDDMFLQQRMPEQHPAIRTTVQLMGKP